MKILRGSRARFTIRLTKTPTLMTERNMNPSSMKVARISQANITIFPFNIKGEKRVNKHDSATEAIFKAVHGKQQPLWGEYRDFMHRITSDST
jgi:hypothetical protein